MYIRTYEFSRIRADKKEWERKKEILQTYIAYMQNMTDHTGNSSTAGIVL